MVSGGPLHLGAMNITKPGAKGVVNNIEASPIPKTAYLNPKLIRHVLPKSLS